jgi:mRNA interferase MazF
LVKKAQPLRGEVWWADLGEPRGSASAFERPVLVVSSDSFNRSRIATVVVLILTSNLRLGDAPGNVVLDSSQSGLDRPSVVNVSQLVTLEKADLRERLGTAETSQMTLVEIGLRKVLGMSGTSP